MKRYNFLIVAVVAIMSVFTQSVFGGGMDDDLLDRAKGALQGSTDLLHHHRQTGGTDHLEPLRGVLTGVGVTVPPKDPTAPIQPTQIPPTDLPKPTPRRADSSETGKITLAECLKFLRRDPKNTVSVIFNDVEKSKIKEQIKQLRPNLPGDIIADAKVFVKINDNIFAVNYDDSHTLVDFGGLTVNYGVVITKDNFDKQIADLVLTAEKTPEFKITLDEPVQVTSLDAPIEQRPTTGTTTTGTVVTTGNVPAPENPVSIIQPVSPIRIIYEYLQGKVGEDNVQLAETGTQIFESISEQIKEELPNMEHILAQASAFLRIKHNIYSVINHGSGQVLVIGITQGVNITWDSSNFEERMDLLIKNSDKPVEHSITFGETPAAVGQQPIAVTTEDQPQEESYVQDGHLLKDFPSTYMVENHINFGFYSKNNERSSRSLNQDFSSVVRLGETNQDPIFFGVFDGHGKSPQG